MTVKISVALAVSITMLVTTEAHARDYDSINLLGRCDYSFFQIGKLDIEKEKYYARYEREMNEFHYWSGRDAFLARDAQRKAENIAYHGDNIIREINELVDFFNRECVGRPFTESVVLEVCSRGMSDFCRRLLNNLQ